MPPDVPTTAEISPAAFSSNAVRLTPREWVVAVVVLATLCCSLPTLWKHIEPFNPGPDYRIPYRLSYDYWMYQRYAGQVASEQRTLLLGDSVVWGHYVPDDQTLSHYLNQSIGESRFANMGVDGIHPVAMSGLVDHYGRPITQTNVILHCNFLWMSSPRHDLQTAKEFTFNHAELVPQFHPPIPCYRESHSRRLSIALGRKLPFFGWTRHLRMTYFDGDTLPEWTVAHPYRNPTSAITLVLPSPNESPTPTPVATPWTHKRLARFNPEWVPLETSFQWRHFRKTLKTLQQQGNRVFVVIGPLNEHMLTPKSLRAYQQLRSESEAWFRAHHVGYFTVPTLSSESYADASHPLATGYAHMARQILESEAFRYFEALGTADQ